MIVLAVALATVLFGSAAKALTFAARNHAVCL
jgi:hypothetical protein